MKHTDLAKGCVLQFPTSICAECLYRPDSHFFKWITNVLFSLLHSATSSVAIIMLLCTWEIQCCSKLPIFFFSVWEQPTPLWPCWRDAFPNLFGLCKMFFFHCWEKNTVLHSAAYSSSNRGGHQGQIPQRHKWKGVGGGEGEGTEGGDRKGEGSKVREGRERGRKGKERKKKEKLCFGSKQFLNTPTVVLSNLRDLQFTWTSSDELNMRVLSYQWMVSLPHSTVSCKNTASPHSLSLSPLFSLPRSFLSSPLICDSFHYYSKNTGRSRTAGFCFSDNNQSHRI